MRLHTERQWSLSWREHIRVCWVTLSRGWYLIKPAQWLGLHCRTPTAKTLCSHSSQIRDLISDAAKVEMRKRRGTVAGMCVSGGYLGNIREVGQMIQYPKQIRAHIPLLSWRCDAKYCSKITAPDACRMLENLPRIMWQMLSSSSVENIASRIRWLIILAKISASAHYKVKTKRGETEACWYLQSPFWSRYLYLVIFLAAVWVSRYLAVQFCFLPEASPDQRLSLVSPSLFGYAIHSWETLAEVTFSPAVFSQLQSEAIWEFTSNMTHWLPWNQSILGSVGRLYGNNEASELSSSCHCCKIHIQDNCSCWALKAAWTAFLQLSGK